MRGRLADRLSKPGVRLRSLPVSSRVALGVLLTVILGAVFAPLLSMDPLQTGSPVQPPSGEHWFGTDRVGRDVFSRVLHGARYSLLIGIGATFVALLLGSALGALAATSAKWLDESVMRGLDVVMAFPGIALAAVLAAVFGTSMPVLIVSIAVVYMPQLARIVRANVMTQYGEDYVAAEKVIGAKRRFILLRHVAINCAAPVLVFCTILVADAIVLEASLSFIGAGVQNPLPSWGNVLSYGRQILLAGGWWATFFPGMAILLTVLALNILSEGMTDASAAPAKAAAPAGGSDTEEPPAERAPVTDTDTSGSLELLSRRLAGQEPRVPPVDEHARELLAVRDLSIRFPDRYGDAGVVDRVSFTVREGETLGLVGESGCGKSVTSLAIMGLQARNAEVAGRIEYAGTDVLTMPSGRRRALAGHEIAMIYQDALSSLNPSVMVGKQLKQLTRRGGARTPAELLDLVGLAGERTLRSYPHELSGGQRQRVLIAMALSRNPRLLVADEPTTALDVTVQAQIVELLERLRDELGFAMLLVSHDLALVGDLANNIAVMYAGQLAEIGPTRSVLADPIHHYSRGLIESVASLEAGAGRLHQVPGMVPSPDQFGRGCRFASRCPAATDLCRHTEPRPTGRDDEHVFACHHPAGSTVLEGSAR